MAYLSQPLLATGFFSRLDVLGPWDCTPWGLFLHPPTRQLIFASITSFMLIFSQKLAKIIDNLFLF
jgi:hypothetical protein